MRSARPSMKSTLKQFGLHSVWATQRLKEYIIKGFALDDDRFKSDTSMNYFNELKNGCVKYEFRKGFFTKK